MSERYDQPLDLGRAFPAQQAASDGAWVCRICGRSYGPMMPACGPCNKRIDEREKQGS